MSTPRYALMGSVFGLFFASCSMAKDPLPLEKHVFKDSTGKTLLYQLLKPEKVDASKKYPLVVFLHGAASAATTTKRNSYTACRSSRRRRIARSIPAS